MFEGAEDKDTGAPPTEESKMFLDSFGEKRRSMNGKLYFLVSCQLILLMALGNEQFSNEDYSAAYKDMPSSPSIVIARFMCAIFLHISLAEEINQSFLMMKYAINHHWKFYNWFNAFLVGFFQMFVLGSVEVVNMMVLLTNPTVMETIMNFLALVIISDFDDYYF
jgi:hypothetical protein